MTNNPSNIQAIVFNSNSPTYLMVIIHGWGASNQNFVNFPNLLALPNFSYLLANAPYRHYDREVADRGGRAWYDIENKPDCQLLPKSRELLLDWLKSVPPKTRVPLERTFLLGFSQGGAMSLDVGMELPLAGICSLSGYLHYEPDSIPRLSQNDNKNLPPVLIAHGTNDTIVTVDAAQKARDKLTRIGVSVKYQEFDMGHEINSSVLDFVRDFVNGIIN